MNYTLLKEAIKGQGDFISRIIAGLEEDQWYAPSRLEGWNILTLVAHTMRAPALLSQYSAKPLNVPPEVDHLSYYNFDGRSIAVGVSQRALDSAAKTSPAAIIKEFPQTVEAALVVLETLAPETVFTTASGPIRLDEYTVTRVVEMGVHGLDLLASLKQPLTMYPAAQQIIVDLLTEFLDGPRPTALSDDIAFIEAATGRVRYPSLIIPAFN